MKNCPKCAKEVEELRGLCQEVGSKSFEVLSELLNIKNERLFTLKYDQQTIHFCSKCKTVYDENFNITKISIT